MTDKHANNKRLVKNTFFMYIRMAFIMVLSFLTTRELLAALGATDFGLLNLIAGIVAMFAFVENTFSTATSRFLNFELGRRNFTALKNIFNLSIEIYAAIAVFTIVIGETFGLWIVSQKVEIPAGKYDDIFWLFQFSLAAFSTGILSIPFRGLIIAYERINIFSIVSVIVALLKLLIVYAIFFIDNQKIIVYAILLFGVSICEFCMYFFSCRIVAGIKIAFFWDKKLFLSLSSFGGFSLFGEMSGIFSDLLINLILNNFFGAIANAARAIAMQISGISAFVRNFLVATNPQIVKYWADDDKSQSRTIAQYVSRVGFFMVLLVATPLIFQMEFLLKIWLGEVPKYTVIFGQLVVVKVLIDTISMPLMTLAQATGKIAVYQMVVGITIWLNFPVSYILLRLGNPPQTVFYVAISIALVCLFERLAILRSTAGLNLKAFSQNVLLRIVKVCIPAFGVPYYFSGFLKTDNFSNLFLTTLICISTTVLSASFLGMTSSERAKLCNLLVKTVKKGENKIR